ncbi:MAG: hypothetical protein KDB05_22940 [Planctomycetales bacterium]|nr:hypothetical protein [Planctomycetales bacterium]
MKWWQVVAFGVATFGYFIFFIASEPKRGLILSLSLLPDQLVHSWCDGDWSRFALLDRTPLIAASAGLLLVAYLAGRLVMERVGADDGLSQLELVVFATGVGLNLISLYTLVVGLAGGLQFRLAFILPGVAILVATVIRWREWFPVSESFAAIRSVVGSWFTERSTTNLAAWTCLPFVIVILMGSLLPPWHFDTREYHSQVPKEWYEQGAVSFMPHNVYGNMPLGAEMHAIVGMNLLSGKDNWWWGALVGKAIIAAYAPLTALALIGFGRRFLQPTAGMIAAFVFISTPWITHVSTSGLIDGASAFYLLATFYGLMIWYQRRRTDESSTPALLLAGFLAGSAVACKYPAVLFVVIPGIVATGCLPLRKLHLRQALTFALAVALACGLWFGKNLVLAENPTYPLLYSVFGGKTRTAEKDLQWTTAHGPPRDAAGRSFSWNSMKDSASLLFVRSEFASPLLLPLAVLGLISRRHRRLVLALAAIVVFNVVAWWLLTHRIDRFLVPILPVIALLAGIGATSYCDRVWQRTTIAILCAGFAFNLVFVTSPLPGDNRFLTSYDVLRRDEPTDGPFSAEHMHRAHKYLNANVRPGFAVMAVGEAQVFDFEMPVLYNTCFDDCVFETMTKDRTNDERMDALREKRISHVFVFWYELDRYRSPGNYGYSDYVTPELIRQEFVDRGILREIPLGLEPGNSQLFEVVGWQAWDDE